MHPEMARPSPRELEQLRAVGPAEHIKWSNRIEDLQLRHTQENGMARAKHDLELILADLKSVGRVNRDDAAGLWQELDDALGYMASAPDFETIAAGNAKAKFWAEVIKGIKGKIAVGAAEIGLNLVFRRPAMPSKFEMSDGFDVHGHVRVPDMFETNAVAVFAHARISREKFPSPTDEMMKRITSMRYGLWPYDATDKIAAYRQISTELKALASKGDPEEVEEMWGVMRDSIQHMSLKVASKGEMDTDWQELFAEARRDIACATKTLFQNRHTFDPVAISRLNQTASNVSESKVPPQPSP
jgi:hypothetical protein